MNSMDRMKRVIKGETLRLVERYPDRYKDGQRLLKFLETVDNAFTRKNLSGHITASGWVVDKDFSKVLLIHHRILDKWIHPGGHLDAGEAPIDGAVREVFEETGVKDFLHKRPDIFDVGVYDIPENTIRQEPEHLHYVLSFILVASSDELSIDQEEIRDAQWVMLDAIVNMPEKFEDSVVRLARRTLRMPSAQS